MAENVFKPLGMQDTTFRPHTLAGRVKKRTALSFMRDAGAGKLTSTHPSTPTALGST